MKQHLRLGFKRFAGRGLRYIVEYRGHRIAPQGWPTIILTIADRYRLYCWQREQ